MMNTPKTSKIKEKSFSQETWCPGLALSQVSTSEASSGETMIMPMLTEDCYRYHQLSGYFKDYYQVLSRIIINITNSQGISKIIIKDYYRYDQFSGGFKDCYQYHQLSGYFKDYYQGLLSPIFRGLQRWRTSGPS